MGLLVERVNEYVIFKILTISLPQDFYCFIFLPEACEIVGGFPTALPTKCVFSFWIFASLMLEMGSV